MARVPHRVPHRFLQRTRAQPPPQLAQPPPPRAGWQLPLRHPVQPLSKLARGLAPWAHSSVEASLLTDCLTSPS